MSKRKIRLTPAERDWLTQVQELLSKAPSDRLGFYTVGDKTVFVYDKTCDAEIHRYSEQHPNAEFCTAVDKAAGGAIACLDFPSSVHSVAG